jgi:hypothetical protein
MSGHHSLGVHSAIRETDLLCVGGMVGEDHCAVSTGDREPLAFLVEGRDWQVGDPVRGLLAERSEDAELVAAHSVRRGVAVHSVLEVLAQAC